LIFLWLLSFYQEKESDMDLWQAKNEQNKFQEKENNMNLRRAKNEQTTFRE